MSYSDVEHFATMVSGCESLTNGNPKASDARYALTVLQLHAGDAGLYSGQEGFLDHIKAGAKNTKDWILKLLKAIRDFFFGRNRNKIRKLATDTEEAAKLLEKDSTEAIVPPSVPEIVKINKQITGSDLWGNAVMKSYNALSEEEKKEAAEKIEKAVSEQNLDELGKNAVDMLKTKLNAKLPRMQSLGNTINEFGSDVSKAFSKSGDDITLDLTGMVRESEKELVDGIETAIKELKISNLSSTIKWFMKIAEEYTKDLDVILVKSKQMVEKTDDSVAHGRIKLVTNAYSELIKAYQDLIIICNHVLVKAIGKTQDKVIKEILSKQATITRADADLYSGKDPDAAIASFYSK